MKQKLLIFLILLIVVGGISAPYSTKAQQTQNTVTCNTQGVCTNPDGSIVDVTDPANNKNTTVNSSEDFSASMWIVNNLFKYIGKFLMILSSAVLGIAGTFFDTVVKFSIIEMAKNIGDPEGVGGSITTAWATLRDIANMCFIFVLLFTAFSAMFNLEFGGVGKAVKNIIIVALLINFSLFFSKVVIDASNIVSVGFYNSIVTTGGSDSQTISNGYMRLLGLQTWNDSSVLDVISDPSKMLLTGVLSSVFMLLMTVILFISGVMFLARFIILIFLMILSPLAAIAYIIPNMQGKFNEWKDALINQSFFAPLFFALTWVVFKVASAPGFLGSYVVKADLKQTAIVLNAPSTSAGLVLNYFLVMGFAVAALVFSKQMASKTNSLTHFDTITNSMGANKAAGVVGGITLGGAAALNRRTLGAAASRFAQSTSLSNWAGKSIIGQKVKEGAEKISKSSFDIRQTKTVGSALQNTKLGSFGTGKSGGYDATLQSQITNKEKIISGLKTDQAKISYAQRQMGGTLTGWYKKGGSRQGHILSLFGTMGRSNRIVASKVINTQLQPLQTQLQTLQGNNLQLNGQLTNAQTELNTYQTILNSGGTLGQRQQARYNILNGAVNIGGSVANIQDQIQRNTAQVNVIQPQAQNLQGQLNNLGLVNPGNTAPLTPQQQAANAAAQAANRPIPNNPRPLRADEQNY